MFPSRRIATMGGDKFRDEYSLAFDGTNDYINCGSGSDIDDIFDGDGGSIVAWINPQSDGGSNYGRICEKASDTDGTGGWTLHVADESSGAVKLAFKKGWGTNRGVWLTDNREIPLNVWTHVAVRYDQDSTSNQAALYINGVRVDVTRTQAPSGSEVSDAAQDFIIGAMSDASRSFDGKISEVVIYNYMLTASQVRTLYNGREPYNHKEGANQANLKAWWRMGDGQFDRNNLPATFKTGIENGDLNQYLITDASATTSLSAEKYTATNALADLNNAEAQTGLEVYEGGSNITSGTAQTDSGRGGSDYAMHIDVSANADRVSDNLDDYLTKGKVYILTCVAKHEGNGDPAVIRIADSSNLDASGDYMTLEQVGTSETGWAFYGTVFLHTSETGDQGSTEHFGIRENGSPDDAEFYISELSIKEVSGNPGVMKNMTITDFTGDTP